MNRTLTVLVLTGAVAFAATAIGDKSLDQAKAKTKSMTVRGEVVDMGCYLGHGARGEKHKSCASRCIAGGMPMGLLTGKNKLYLLTLNHDDAAPFNQAKELAGSQVEVSGALAERDGISALDVASIKAVAPAGGK